MDRETLKAIADVLIEGGREYNEPKIELAGKMIGSILNRREAVVGVQFNEDQPPMYTGPAKNHD